jgi:hypothetical protein
MLPHHLTLRTSGFVRARPLLQTHDVEPPNMCVASRQNIYPPRTTRKNT